MKKVLLFLFLIAYCACSNSKKESCKSIDIEDALIHLEGLFVTDISEHVSYIPLETTDESLIGKRAYVRLLKDKLLVGSFQQPIKMLDKKTGHFIKVIGGIGQGMNEYVLQDGIPVFWVDDKAEIIYVQTEGKKMLRFDANGNSLSSINLPDSFPRLTEVPQISMGDKLYAYKQTLFNKSDYKIFIYNIQNGEVQKCFYNEDEVLPSDFSQTPVFFTGFGNIPVSTCCQIFALKDGRMAFFYTENPCLWSFGDNVYFKENFNDTIYEVVENKMNPKLVFNLGKMHCDYKDRFKVEDSKIAIDYILEGKTSLFFVFEMNYYKGPESKTYWGIYNKQDEFVKVTDKLQIEDAKNGTFTGKLQTATADGKLIGLVDAASFMENVKNENVFNMSEEDNPVVVIFE